MQKLFSTDHKIFHLPTLKISSNHMDPVNSDEFDAFIFTSANAIRNLQLKNNNKKTLNIDNNKAARVSPKK